VVREHLPNLVRTFSTGESRSGACRGIVAGHRGPPGRSGAAGCVSIATHRFPRPTPAARVEIQRPADQPRRDHAPDAAATP
jgi:hypothetical protein